MQADGIFSGGGIKGIAFVGGLQAAAEAGYNEWVQVGGTSAGAIIAMALAVGYDATSLRNVFETFDFSKIEDDKPWLFGKGYDLIFKQGLTRGEVLHDWIRDLIKQSPKKAQTFGELGDTLRVVGSDLTHNRMVVFPDDVGLYLDGNDRALRPEDFPVADAVRISAGFPFFFPPLSLKHSATLKQGMLVDGGVTSQFPLFLFEKSSQPTWGFRLFDGLTAGWPNYDAIDGLDWPKDMLLAIVDTATNSLDNFEADRYPDRVINIPTGSVDTLNFNLSQADKNFLYDSGYAVSRDFFASRSKP